MSKKAKLPEDLFKKKRVKIIDRNYRISAVLPLKNRTGISDYDFLGRSIQKFLAERLRIIDKIRIMTNEIRVPLNLRTNENIVIVFETNLKRNLVWLKPETVNEIIIKKRPDSWSRTADYLEADYLVGGYFDKYRGAEWSFKFKVYNSIMKSYSGVYSLEFNHKKILDNINLIFNLLKVEFQAEKIERFYIKTVPEGVEVVVNEETVGKSPLSIYIDIERTNSIILKKKGFKDGKLDMVDLKVTNSIRLEREDFETLLSINSEPEAGEVFVDVKSFGFTPLVITNIRPAIYRLRLSKPGFADWYKKVRLRDGKQVTLTAKLISTNIEKAEVQKKEIYKRWIYILAGSGTLTALLTYIFYYNMDLNDDRYMFATNEEKRAEYWKKARNFETAMWISGGTSLLFYSGSIYFLFRYLRKEDIKIGKSDNFIFACSFRF